MAIESIRVEVHAIVVCGRKNSGSMQIVQNGQNSRIVFRRLSSFLKKPFDNARQEMAL